MVILDETWLFFCTYECWVQHIFDDCMTYLSVAQIEVECDLDIVTTNAVIVGDDLDQEQYILGN